MTLTQSPSSNRRQAIRWFVIIAAVLLAIVPVAAHLASAKEDTTTITSFEDRIPPPHSVIASIVDGNLFVDWRLGTIATPHIDGLGLLRLDSFTVERRELTASGAGFWRRLASHLAGTGHESAEPLLSGRTYEFRVAAYYVDDTGDITYRYKTTYSESGSFTAPTVPAPSDLIVSSGEESLTLSWTKPDSFDHDVLEHTGYIILRSSVSIAEAQHASSSVIELDEIELSDVEAMTWQDDATVDTMRYHYQILAVYDFVHSPTTGGAFYEFIQGVGSSS